MAKELRKARVVTAVLAGRSAEFRAEGEALIRKADGLACESWNEKMWADGGPIDPSPLVDQAINGGFLLKRCLSSLARPAMWPVKDTPIRLPK